MKITKIEVCDFRGFPGPGVYDFEFGTARSLFVYGENGSGKSSLFRAIQEFFNRNSRAVSFAGLRNTDTNPSGIGRVTVHFDDGTSQSWSEADGRPATAPSSQTALQVGCLDYRSLLETNFAQKGNQVDIFGIAVRHLVPNIETPVAGGTRRIGELWSAVHRPRYHYKDLLRNSKAAADRFNEGFQPLIAPLIGKATELLTHFPACNVTLSAAFRPIEYDKVSRQLMNQELFLQVYRNGALLPKHHDFLNEARLSAIALVIYMAGLLISVPTASQYPKLIVLDDVLVGLDMENRRPVLAILQEFFADWQIVLLTHDKVWYETAQVELPGHAVWKAYELWVGPDQRPVHRPREGGPDFFLSTARQHLANNDKHASALYARMACEAKMKNYCDRWSLPVPYKKDPRRIDLEKFWTAAKDRARKDAEADGAVLTRLNALFHAVDVAKKIVLNQLSHTDAPNVPIPEIQAGINAVGNLRFD